MPVSTQWGHPPPFWLTATVLPVGLTLIAHPLLPLLLSAEILPQPTFPALQANIGFSLLAFLGAVHSVSWVGGAFVDKGLKGRDLCKAGGRSSGPWV